MCSGRAGSGLGGGYWWEWEELDELGDFEK